MKEKNRRNRANEIARDRKIKRLVAIGVIVALVIGIGVVVSSSKIILSGASASSPPIDNIQCNSMEQAAFHIHAHLDILINGQPYTIPSQIAIIPGKCFYWLHTHDDSGVIHIESPITRNFTLGQVFDIWNKKFTNTQILDNIVDNKNTLSVYVNGTQVNPNVNYKDIKLSGHDEIAIVYGSRPPPNSIPSKYSFAQGL
jgi:hypothetical protein